MCGVDCVVFGSIVVDVGEALAAVEVGTAGRECSSHFGYACGCFDGGSEVSMSVYGE